LKKRIISEAEDFNVKEQKLMEQLVQSKIAMMHQEEFADNLQGQNFVGDFLDIWANLEDIGDVSLGGDFFPMRQQPMGLIQIPKIFDNLLVQECIENEDKLELVKQRFANEKDRAEKEIQFHAQQSTVGRANSAAINDDNYNSLRSDSCNLQHVKSPRWNLDSELLDNQEEVAFSRNKNVSFVIAGGNKKDEPMHVIPENSEDNYNRSGSESGDELMDPTKPLVEYTKSELWVLNDPTLKDKGEQQLVQDQEMDE